MAKCKKPSAKVSKAATTLSTSKSPKAKSEAAKILKEHQDNSH